MGKRQRRDRRLAAPTVDYTDDDGNVLTLRTVMTAGTRQEYARARGGSPLSLEDAWQRAAELLFERLAARWVIQGMPIERQRELLGRFRLASPAERAWVRDALRRHLAEHFPELEAP